MEMQNIQISIEKRKRKTRFFKHGVKPKKPKASYPSEKSRWAYWMQAIEPDHPAINAAFPEYHPLWIQHSQRLQVTGEQFQFFRKHLLAITQKQSAAYLRVKLHLVQAWEQGREPVPFMAFEILRLVFESATFKLSHPEWDGWFIDRQTGKLVSPDRGNLSFSPVELSCVRENYGSKDRLQAENDRLHAEVSALQQEAAELRDFIRNGDFLAELHDMKTQLETMLASIGSTTAKVYQFPQPEQPKKAATA
jgi:DNA-binding transcriptional regulator YiaG